MSLGSWGALRAPDDPEAYDFERLERAVEALVERQTSLDAENQRLRAHSAELQARSDEFQADADELRAENAKLREEGAARSGRMSALERELRQANQRRHDVAKRIDDLVEKLRLLETHFEAQTPPASSTAPDSAGEQ